MYEGAMESAAATVSGPINNQIDRQRDIIERLDHQISRITKRLEPILSQHYAAPSAENLNDVPSMCPMATSLYVLNDKLDELTHALSVLEDRIEL